MPIVMDLSPAYFAPVKVSLLDADGNLQQHQFDVQFVRLNKAGIETFIEDQQSAADDIVFKVVRNWRHVTDAQGLSVPFSEDNLKLLLAVPGMGNALLQAFVASWVPKEGCTAAGEEAAQKN